MIQHQLLLHPEQAEQRVWDHILSLRFTHMVFSIVTLLFHRRAGTGSRWSLSCRTSLAPWWRRSWWPPCTRSAPGHWGGCRRGCWTPPACSSRPSGPRGKTTSPWWGGSHWGASHPPYSWCWWSSPWLSSKAWCGQWCDHPSNMSVWGGWEWGRDWVSEITLEAAMAVGPVHHHSKHQSGNIVTVGPCCRTHIVTL